MKKHTVKGTLAAIRANGCTASHQDGEYRVALAGRHNRSLDAAKVDIKVQHHGSIVMLEPVSAEAKHFVQAFVHVPDYAWHGNAFAVEPRYADDLLSGMASNGLNVAS